MTTRFGMWLAPIVVYPLVYPMAFIGALLCEAFYRKSSFRSHGKSAKTTGDKFSEDRLNSATVALESELEKMRQDGMAGIQSEIAARKKSMESQLEDANAGREREIDVEIENKRKLELAKLESEISEKKDQAKRELEEAHSEREAIEQEVRAMKDDRAAVLDEELEKERGVRLENLEKELSEYKEKELEKISEWSEREVGRLRGRLELEYKMQLAELQTDLTEKVQQEFEQIHRFFESVKEEEKAVAEGEIMDFLKQKEKDIVKLIKVETPPK